MSDDQHVSRQALYILQSIASEAEAAKFYGGSEEALLDDLVTFTSSIIVLTIAADGVISEEEEDYIREYLAAWNFDSADVNYYIESKLPEATACVSKVPQFFRAIVAYDKRRQNGRASMTVNIIKHLVLSIAGADGHIDADETEVFDDAVAALLAFMAKNDLEYRDESEDDSAEKDEHDTKQVTAPGVGIDQLLERLTSLIGLEQVKAEVSSLVNLVKIRRLRESKGIKSPPLSLHLVFTGNPGTGKTTVARLLGQIYKELGVLEKGHLIEVDRSGLVAGYIGQTALKVKEVCQKALGGILFIDEAYTLATAGEQDFGREAIDTLLKFMEDKRDNFIVIAAGYTDKMEGFLNSNPGLQSRFNKFIRFADYDAEELFNIFKFTSVEHGYSFDEAFSEKLRDIFGIEVSLKPANFANGRMVRNLFEKVIASHANRLAAHINPSEAELTRFELADISLFEQQPDLLQPETPPAQAQIRLRLSKPIMVSGEYASSCVSAETLYSCFLACIESLTKDLGRPIVQGDMLARFSNTFPRWETQAGFIHDLNEAVQLLILTGFSGDATTAATKEEILKDFNPKKGGFIFTDDFYNASGEIADINHSLRLLKASDEGIVVMNPCRKPSPGVIQEYPWTEFNKWHATAVLFV